MIASPTGRQGFTLIEMMVAVTILTLISLILAGLLLQSSSVWIRGENDSDYHNRARAALDYIKRDLEEANLAANQAALVAAGQPTLELLVSPASITAYPDTIFWQAPIATDNRSQGDMAEVGYFIRWVNGHGTLCRFFVNPSDTTFYNVYTGAPGSWISQSLLDQVAPGTSTNLYRGLFLSDIVGLWVRVYPDPATSSSPYTNPYDSSAPPDAAHPLPALAVIQIAVLDSTTATRVAQAYGAGSSAPSAFTSAYAAANTPAADANSSNASFFVAALNQLNVVHGGARAFGLRVRLNNYRLFALP